MGSEWTFQTLQLEQKLWVLKNFGLRPSWMPLLGMAEEMEELSKASRQHDLEGFDDAVADIVIFMADFCTAMHFDLEALFYESCFSPDALWAGATFEFRPIADYYGIVARGYLKHSQGIRGTPEKHLDTMREGLRGMISFLFVSLGERRQLGLHAVVRKVWETEVKPRDWKAYPSTGRPPEAVVSPNPLTNPSPLPKVAF